MCPVSNSNRRQEGIHGFNSFQRETKDGGEWREVWLEREARSRRWTVIVVISRGEKCELCDKSVGDEIRVPSGRGQLAWYESMLRHRARGLREEYHLEDACSGRVADMWCYAIQVRATRRARQLGSRRRQRLTSVTGRAGSCCKLRTLRTPPCLPSERLGGVVTHLCGWRSFRAGW